MKSLHLADRIAFEKPKFFAWDAGYNGYYGYIALNPRKRIPFPFNFPAVRRCMPAWGP